MFVEFAVKHGFYFFWACSKYRWKEREKVGAEDGRIKGRRRRSLVVWQRTVSVDSISSIYECWCCRGMWDLHLSRSTERGMILICCETRGQLRCQFHEMAWNTNHEWQNSKTRRVSTKPAEIDASKGRWTWLASSSRTVKDGDRILAADLRSWETITLSVPLSFRS